MLLDSDIVVLLNELCKLSDVELKIVLVNSVYVKCLMKVMKGFGDMMLNGQKINYKVYLIKDVNVWVMGNGCVCVYSGLMDMMNDDELCGVIGYEMGYVVFGYLKKVMQIVYVVSVVCSVVGVVLLGVVVLLSLQFGDIIEKFINVQFLQLQESVVDDYLFDLMKQKGMNQKGFVIGFQKFVQMDGGQSLMMSLYLLLVSCVQYIQDCIVKGS